MSSVHQQRRMAFGLVALAAAAFVLSVMSAEVPDEPEEATPPAEPGEAGEPGRSGKIHRSVGTRSPLRRPERQQAADEAPARDDSEAGGEADGEARVEAEVDTGALPEAGHAAAGVPFTPDNLISAMESVTPDITDCVEDWQEVLHAELSGTLTLEMTLSPEGVLDAALVDVEGVPDPMIGCFGGVIYEAEWPLPEEVTDVAWPFVLTSD